LLNHTETDNKYVLWTRNCVNGCVMGGSCKGCGGKGCSGCKGGTCKGCGGKGCSGCKGKGGSRGAICILEDHSNSGVSGQISLMQSGPCEPVKITGVINGLKPGKHGFHIHEFGDLTDGCNTAGAHYNPFSKTHGGPGDEVRHVGDLGNVVCSDNGKTLVEIEDKQITLFGDLSVIGRSFVVHTGEDDLGKGNHEDSKTTGHAGGRLACGVIALAKCNCEHKEGEHKHEHKPGEKHEHKHEHKPGEKHDHKH